jgi:hypothetical protein
MFPGSSSTIMNGTTKGIISNLFGMKRMRNPPVIKVTGPDALLFGYRQFLGEKFVNNQRMKSNGYHVGTDGKVVYKMLGRNISPTNLPRGMTEKWWETLPDYISSKKGYADIVFSNLTLNVTRMERMSIGRSIYLMNMNGKWGIMKMLVLAKIT